MEIIKFKTDVESQSGLSKAVFVPGPDFEKLLCFAHFRNLKFKKAGEWQIKNQGEKLRLGFLPLNKKN